MCTKEMVMDKYPQDADRLRAEFTRWLAVLLDRTRANYLRNRSKSKVELMETEETIFVDAEDYTIRQEFVFENERLELAFLSLSTKQRELLVLLFVESMSPIDIAQQFKCTIQHIYNQKSIALKLLRVKMEEGSAK